MDDTQGSRMSDAVATRKRRSSILKNQRPPRTPFSELEFNVATPTDTGKSRRVSFSRRTDVAEFVTNEATTTWKNMYVEQNRSLESSGNESALHPSRQTVCHLGKRIFDQQFQEVEVDYASMAPNPLVRDMNASLMNVNFTQQIADLENPKQHKLEMSSVTEDKSRLFTDLTAPSIGLTDGINIDFSVVQPVGKCDDLDEIQRDLRSQASLHRPFPDTPGTDYIEVDLNTTHVGVGHEIASDMSITDTIRSPEVKSQQNKGPKCDWIVDKENIAVNPYAAPKESLNFAINDIPDQVLVFDGRRLTERRTTDAIEYRQSLPKAELGSQRKTIVLNVNDDLPNFVDDASLLGQMHGLSTSKVETKNISNLPNTVLETTDENPVMQKTVYDNDLSVTQAVLTNILQKEKRQTIVFDSEACELSMTQALPTNHLLTTQNQNKTQVYSDDISFTQAVPAKVLLSENVQKLPNNSVTLVENNFEISFTQALPNNIVLSQKSNQNNSNTTVYGKDVDISITRVLPSNIIVIDRQKVDALKSDRVPIEKSIVYDQGCDISMTQAVPKSIILSNAIKSNDTNTAHDDNNVSETKLLPSNIVDFNNPSEKSTRDPFNNMSMTEAIPGNVLISQSVEKSKTEQTSDFTDISMTKALPTNIVTNERNMTNGTQNNTCITQSAQENVLILNVVLNGDSRKCDKETKTEETQTVESVSRDLCKSQENMSITQAVQTDDLPNGHLQSNDEVVSDDNSLKNKEEETKNQKSICIFKSEYENSKLDSSGVKTSEALSEEIVKCTQNDNSHDATDFNDNTSRLTKQDTAVTVNLNNETNNAANISLFDKKPLQNPNQNDMDRSGNRNNISRTFVMNKSATDVIHQDVFVYQAVTERNMSKIETADDEMDVDVENEKTFSSESPKKMVNLTQEQIEESYTKNVEGNLHLSQKKPRKSILTELLKMSDDSIDVSICGGDNKAVELESESENVLERVPKTECFPIRKDDEPIKECDSNRSLKIAPSNFEVYEEKYPDKTNIDIAERCNKNDVSVNIECRQISEKSKRSRESLESLSDECDSKDTDKNQNTSNLYKEADDTKELLEMLSDFTDRTINKQSKIDAKTEELAMEENSNSSAPRPLSIAKSRMSIVLSREDLLMNISMAHAALQQARTDTDESDDELDDEEDAQIDEIDVVDQIDAVDVTEVVEDIKEATEEVSSRRSVRASTEVVKTLQFDDSVNDPKSEDRLSPLRKTLPSNISRTSDKGKVIPPYLNASVEVKTLMDDLVKPIADDVTWDKTADRSTKDLNTTRNISLQANIITSSQVDIIESEYDMISADAQTDPEDFKNCPPLQLRKSVVECTESDKSVANQSKSKIVNPAPVLIFDHNNPLNNISLSPTGKNESHKYSPINVQPLKVNSSPVKSFMEKNNGDEYNIQRVSTHYHINKSPVRMNTKESEVNTSIAMKNNKELLEETSCLTLVDDDEELILIEDSQPLQPDAKLEMASPLRVIFKLDGDENSASSDFDTDDANKAKKRVYSPAKREGKAASNIDVTPKPLSKVQKLSNSPRIKVTPENTNAGKLEKSNIKRQTRGDSMSFCNKVIVLQSECVKVEEKADNIDLLSESSSRSTLKTEKFEECVSDIPCSTTSSLYTGELKFSTASSMSKGVYSSQNTEYVDSVQSFDTASLTKSSKEFDSNEGYKEIKSSIKSKEIASVQTCKETCNNSNNKKFNQSIKEFDSNRNLNGLTSSDDSKVTTIQSCKETNTNQSNKAAVQSQEITLKSSMKEIAPIQTPKEADSTETDNPSNCCTNKYGSSNMLPNSESNVNILDKIDALPFMGTRDCEWDWSDAETMRFRLMRGRLRLVVRLRRPRAPSRVHVHSRRAHVPHDAYVLHAAVELAHEDADPLARTCARLASEAMRYECVRICGGASTADSASATGSAPATDPASASGLASVSVVPALLRRCAAVARLARRWARVMRDARAHLAYTVAGDGGLALKVANIPLRTVYEVSLRIELVVEDAREAAWARAGRLRVRDVTAGCHARHAADGTQHAGHAGDAESVHARDLQRLLARVPHDWGHVPRTLWKVFRHLKNKTKDDELLGI